MRISEIDWGNDSAEKDPNLLSYFVDHSSLPRLYKRSKTFIIGRKGAGKSAIRKKIVEEFQKWDDNYIIEVTPTFNIFSNLISDSDIKENFNQEVFFQYVWLNFLFKKALIDIGINPKNESSEAFGLAKSLAKANGLKEKSLLESARDLLGRIKVKAGKLGELGIEIEKTLRQDAEIELYENSLKQICSEGYKITWVVDDLDLGWNNSEVANNLLLGLLTCSNYIKNLSSHLHVFICLREDVYRILLTHTQHSDKYRDVEKIQWQVQDLIHLLETRIRYNYHQHNISAPQNLFSSVFPETVSTSSSITWIMERTLGRPRELLQLVRLYSERNDTDKPDPDILKSIELEYSNWKLEDLTTEFSNQYPNLFELFKYWKSKFYRNKYSLKRAEFEDIFLEMATNLSIACPWYMEAVNSLDPSKLLKILYDIGFLGDFILGGAGGSKTFYSFQELHEPVLDDIQIHPCFRKALGTVERIRKRAESTHS